MNTSLILATISGLIILEGIFIAFSQKQTRKMFLTLSKSKNLFQFGIIEAIIGLIILIISISLKT